VSDPSAVDGWVGRERIVEDTVSLQRARALGATLDLDTGGLEEGDPLPPGWHWIYFHTAARRSDLAEDGHELRGDFLPPLELPRRMWAGGRLSFPGALRIGEPARRESVVRSVERKEGRSGPLVFVTVEHRISGPRGLAVREEQSLVYLDRRHRPKSSPRSPPTHPAELAGKERPDWTGSFAADEVTLFRFSALTFNSHRIHYDNRYATEVEGYPGIVVHGPLLALVLLSAGVRWAGLDRPGPEAKLTFRYRAMQPVFCNEPVEVRGRDLGHRERRTLALCVAHRDRGIVTDAQMSLRGGGTRDASGASE
jgi:3-methylfumaryl-CoA hydratase